MPNENGALSANRHNELLVGCNCDLCNGATVSSAVIVGESLVVAPKFDNLVLTAANEVFSFGGDGESVDLAG